MLTLPSTRARSSSGLEREREPLRRGELRELEDGPLFVLSRNALQPDSVYRLKSKWQSESSLPRPQALDRGADMYADDYGFRRTCASKVERLFGFPSRSRARSLAFMPHLLLPGQYQ